MEKDQPLVFGSAATGIQRQGNWRCVQPQMRNTGDWRKPGVHLSAKRPHTGFDFHQERKLTVKKRGNLAAAFNAVSSTGSLPAGDYPAVLEDIQLLEFNPARGQSVRARFDVGAERLLEAWWRLIDYNREPVKGGIIGIKILLDRLGYEYGTYDLTEEALSELFAEISQAKPELDVRVSYKDQWQNVRVLRVKGDSEG
jgi:hypothetical protein